MKITKKDKNIARKIISILLIIFGTVIFMQLLIPMVIGLCGIVMSLSKIYPLLDMNFKFAGGCFFLIIYWYVFCMFARAVIRIMEAGLMLFNKKDKK